MDDTQRKDYLARRLLRPLVAFRAVNAASTPFMTLKVLFMASIEALVPLLYNAPKSSEMSSYLDVPTL